MSQSNDPVPPTTPMDAPTTTSPDQRLGQPAPGWWLASDGQWYPPQTQPGYAQPGAVQPYGQPGYAVQYVDPNAKSKIIAGILQLTLGSFGAGRFYLGYTGMAIAQIAVTWLTCGIGAIWPLIDGVMILTGSVPTDADGRPLKD